MPQADFALLEIAADFGLKGNVGCADQVHIITNAVEIVENYLDEQGIDLWTIVQEKMEYNRARPWLHGKKY